MMRLLYFSDTLITYRDPRVFRLDALYRLNNIVYMFLSSTPDTIWSGRREWMAT